MPDPIQMEHFQKGVKGRRYEDQLAKSLEKAHPDDWIWAALGQDIEKATKHSPVITHAHVEKLRRALREQPENVLSFLRESIVPFIARLPGKNRTIVGADTARLGGNICLKCLSSSEAARLSGGDFLTRDDADDYKLVCARCGKPL